jgi:hypothetical protein
MILTPQQLAFPSLSFDKDRTVLYVGEVAKRWSVTDQHVIDLLEEGKLHGFDIAGRQEFLRVPASAVDALAAKFNVPREVIVETMRSAPPTRHTGRAFWRVPVKEGFEAFMKENHSLASRR